MGKIRLNKNGSFGGVKNSDFFKKTAKFAVVKWCQIDLIKMG